MCGVSKCNECPFQSPRQGGAVCGLAYLRGATVWLRFGEVPEECPLREGPITVSLAAEEASECGT